MTIPVVDVFAGPGGLGEGFSAFDPTGSGRTPFRIAISAEMETNAARTLKLRAFFRQFPSGGAPKSYYEYVAGSRKVPWTESSRVEWERANEEARQLTLGKHEDDAVLHRQIRPLSKKDEPWILVGGPPCQAYSLVGRARNVGIAGYRAEEDSRHFLYQHYLRILHEFRPAAFVMENVKGILSSKVGGERMFPKILEDLQRAGGKRGHKYRIVPLVMPAGLLHEPTDGRDFILRAEELGVPQARHRVVLLGLSEGIEVPRASLMCPSADRYSVADVIAGLPALRSGVTDREVESWQHTARFLLEKAAAAAADEKVSRALLRSAKEVQRFDPGQGSRHMPKTTTSDQVPTHLKKWLVDRRLGTILNHEVRGHMAADLVRYAYASAFAQVHGHSPRGAAEFPEKLAPKHRNWNSGKFVDRFKVQLAGVPSSTVTSHLSKDGHYFIHPDPAQLRSLSVREAARLQTFPDNYFFEGARGAQFKQVGNAVPPWMATQIARVVYSCLAS